MAASLLQAVFQGLGLIEELMVAFLKANSLTKHCFRLCQGKMPENKWKTFLDILVSPSQREDQIKYNGKHLLHSPYSLA